MLFEWDDACFMLQVMNRCCVSASSGDPEGCVFCGLDFPHVGVSNVWVPRWVCICNDGSDVLFVKL